jgi:hypothetical protein
MQKAFLKVVKMKRGFGVKQLQDDTAVQDRRRRSGTARIRRLVMYLISWGCILLTRQDEGLRWIRCGIYSASTAPGPVPRY